MKLGTRHAIAAFLMAGIISPVCAQTTIPQEYDKTIKSAEVVGALGADLFGEQINFYTGTTTFSAMDISLAGNNALLVAIGRTFTVTSRDDLQRDRLLFRDGGFADWDLDIPHLHGVFAHGQGWQVDGWDTASDNSRCGLVANAPEPPMVGGGLGGYFTASEYWSGNSLYVPGVGDQTMLVLDPTTNPYRPTDGSTYTQVTNSQWYFSCKPQTANGVPGDAFIAHAPDGTRYTFDWIVSRPESIITKPYKGPIEFAPSTPNSPMHGRNGGDTTPQAIPDPNVTSLLREEVWILPTRVEDRFGNVVAYTYDPAHPWRLLSIVASDGRQLTLTYDANGHIATVSDGSRIWQYIYGSGLTEVRLPDQSKWTIDFANLRNARIRPATNPNPQQCNNSPSGGTQYTYTGTLTHPSGATGSFNFYPKQHRRSYVPKRCIKLSNDPANPADFAWWPKFFDVLALTQKTLSGPGMATAQWTYSYSMGTASWAEDCVSTACTITKTVDVTGPGDFRRYTFSNKYGESEGKLLKLETGTSAGNILRTETTDYLTNPTGQAYPAMVGGDPFNRSDRTAEAYRPVFQRVVTQQGRSFTWQVATDCASGYCFDQYARPAKIIKSSAPSP